MPKDIDYSILPESFTPMYKIHKYWGRKPWNIFREYIKNYSSENDIILDPFCGSGLAVAEALKLNRRVIAIDINPMAIFITRQLITPIDLLKFEHAFSNIVKHVEGVFEKEYTTNCKKCKTYAKVEHFIWERPKLKDSRNTERKITSLTYICPKCGPIRSEPDESDIELSNKQYLNLLPKFFVERNKKLHVSIRRTEAKYYFDLFTQRNLYLLFIIYNEILKINDKKLKDIMTLVFTSSLIQSSRLNMISKNKSKDEITISEKSKGRIAPNFEILREYIEKNPLTNFINSYQTVFNAKKESNKEITNCVFAETFADLVAGKGNVLLINNDIRQLDNLTKNSIDYIIADPPFVKDIRYLELSQIWLNWLGEEVDINRELKVESLTDNEKNKEYTEGLTNSFKKVHSCLKDNKFLTVTYQTNEVNAWTTMVQSPVNAGFVLRKIVPQGVPYSISADYRSLMKKGKHKLRLGYDYLTFVKNKLDGNFQNGDKSVESFDKRIIHRVTKIIKKRQEPTPFIFLILNLYESMSSEEIKKYSTADIIKILETSDNVREYITAKDPRQKNPLWQKWTFKKYPFNKTKSLETQVRSDLEEMLLYDQVSDNQYIQLIMNKFKGESLVSGTRVKRLLDEISKKTSKGRRLNKKRIEVVADRKRAEIIKNLTKLGESYFPPFKSKVLSKSSLLWSRHLKPTIMFYITLAGKMPHRDIERESMTLRNMNSSFQRIIIRPRAWDQKFEKEMTKHWDYIWLERLEQLMHEKKIIERFIRIEKPEPINKKKVVKATILKNENEGDKKYFKLVLNEPYIQNTAQPGQFINILCPTGTKRKKQVFHTEEDYITYLKNGEPHSKKPLLRRPISIHRIYYKDFQPQSLKIDRDIPKDLLKILRSGRRDRFDVFIKVVGEGTRILSNAKSGAKLDIIGPLGKPLKIDEKTEKALLVAGGIGIAPLYALAEELRWTGRKVILFLGAYDEHDLKILGYGFHTDDGYEMEPFDAQKLSKEFEEMGIEVVLCTISDNIPRVKKGMIPNVFAEFLSDKIKKNSDYLNNTEVFSCGPKAMMKAVDKIANKFNLPHKVFLEERMGCGLGVCMSCVCKTNNNDTIEYKRICTEGPVFDTKEIAWY